MLVESYDVTSGFGMVMVSTVLFCCDDAVTR